MRAMRTAGLAGIVLAGILAACGTAAPVPANVVNHNGVTYCGYTTEATKQTECGKSGIPETNWVSPGADETFDTADGIDIDDRMVAVLLCKGDSLTQAQRAGADAQLRRITWAHNNPNICAQYEAWLKKPVYKLPSPTPSPKPSAAATKRLTQTPAPSTSPTKSPRPR